MDEKIMVRIGGEFYSENDLLKKISDAKTAAPSFCRSLGTLKPNTMVLLICPSGVINTPYRVHVGQFSTDYNRYRDHANDSVSDYGGDPIGWMPLPWEESSW